MIQEENVIVIDIDGTLCEKKPPTKSYSEVEPLHENVRQLKNYKEQGFYIILYTSRQMRTHQGNMGRINADTAKVLFEWLDRHEIPYDEIHFGKPWCGKNGFYIDDKTIRPREFRELSFDEIHHILDRDI